MPPVQAAEPAISSLSAVVYEPQGGLFLYEKDGHTPRPMASTTKLMTALLAAECLSPQDMVTVAAGAVPVEGTQIGLAAGQTVKVEDLLTGLLLSSGNDAANALALAMDESYEAFSQRMNRKAAALGMGDSHFVTPSGLDAAGHGASARDMALLGAAVLKQPLLADLCDDLSRPVTLNGGTVTLYNHNKLLKKYPGCIGMKTGFTKKAGRCLVSAAQKDGITLIIATLNGGDYWNDHIKLYDYAFSLVEQQTPASLPPVQLPVAGGEALRVSIVADAPPNCVTRKGEKLITRVELPAFLWAPVTAGTQVGRAIYTAGGRELAVVPLRTAEGVAARWVPGPTALWWRRVCQLVESLLT